MSHMNNFFLCRHHLNSTFYFYSGTHIYYMPLYYPLLLVCFYDKSNLYALYVRRKGIDFYRTYSFCIVQVVIYCESRVTSIELVGWLIFHTLLVSFSSSHHNTFQQNTFFSTDFVFLCKILSSLASPKYFTNFFMQCKRPLVFCKCTHHCTDLNLKSTLSVNTLYSATVSHFFAFSPFSLAW